MQVIVDKKSEHLKYTELTIFQIYEVTYATDSHGVRDKSLIGSHVILIKDFLLMFKDVDLLLRYDTYTLNTSLSKWTFRPAVPGTVIKLIA